MGLNHSEIRDLTRRIDPSTERRIEGIVSVLYSTLDDLTADESLEVAARAVSLVAIKAMVAILAKHGHLTDNSVDRTEFHRCVKWFAFELITELRTKSRSTLTDELTFEIAEAWK